MCTNITANSISAANDLTVLFPRFLNIRRGSVLAAVIGAWVFVPWRIVASASNFLTFMGGYSIFLAPIAAIICCDYWIVKKQKIDIADLYDPHGRYRYWYGINWRALVAFLAGFLPNFPGLLHAVSASTGNVIQISVGAQHLYKFDWLFGFVMGSFVYVILNLVAPDKASMASEDVLEAREGTEVVDDEKLAGRVKVDSDSDK